MNQGQDSEIVRLAQNIDCYPWLKIQVRWPLFDYMLRKYDVIGAISSCNTGAAFETVNAMLEYGIEAYISMCGYKVPKCRFMQKKLFRVICSDSILIDAVNGVNEVYDISDKDEAQQFFDEVVRVVEGKLIPESFWEFAKTGLINWQYIKTDIAEITLMNNVTGWDRIYGKVDNSVYESRAGLIKLSELAFDNWKEGAMNVTL